MLNTSQVVGQVTDVKPCTKKFIKKFLGLWTCQHFYLAPFYSFWFL